MIRSMSRLRAETVSQIPVISNSGPAVRIFRGCGILFAAALHSWRETVAVNRVSTIRMRSHDTTAQCREIRPAGLRDRARLHVRAAGWALARSELEQIDVICAEPA